MAPPNGVAVVRTSPVRIPINIHFINLQPSRFFRTLHTFHTIRTPRGWLDRGQALMSHRLAFGGQGSGALMGRPLMNFLRKCQSHGDHQPHAASDD